METMLEQETFSDYLPQIKKRWQTEQASWTQRRKLAWGYAQQIAEMLHTTFGAEQVIAFGSLTGSGPFDDRSDIDLAVSGIAPVDFFRATVRAMSLAGEFELDLLDLAECPPAMRAVILDRGVAL